MLCISEQDIIEFNKTVSSRDSRNRFAQVSDHVWYLKKDNITLDFNKSVDGKLCSDTKMFDPVVPIPVRAVKWISEEKNEEIHFYVYGTDQFVGGYNPKRWSTENFLKSLAYEGYYLKTDQDEKEK